MSESSLFQNQIKVQRQYMWLSILWALFTLLLGITITLLWFKASKEGADKTPDFYKMGPTLISAFMTSFPLNIWMKCRTRISTYLDLENLTDEEAKKQAAKQALSALLTNWGQIT